LLDDNYIRSGLLSENSSIFEELFHELYNKLCNYALRFLSSPEEAEEVVQQCFVKLWERRTSADSIKSFKSYLYKSVHNSCLNLFEHEKIKRQYASEAEYKLKQIYTSEFQVSYSDDLKDKLELFIEELPEKNKEVFKLRFYEGYNTKEVSEMLQITPRTVETHVSKSLKILRDCFKQIGALLLLIFFFALSYVIYVAQLS